MRKRMAIIQNPVSGRPGGIFAATLRHLEALDVDVQVLQTQRAGEGGELARRMAAEPGWDAVVAAGGDGTCNEVAGGLLGTGVAMGIIPTGTANVLAAEIGLAPEPEAVARTLAAGDARPVCVGQANDRIFMLMVGAGWDARVVASVDSRLKKKLGRWAYAVQGLRHLCSAPADPLRISLAGKVEEGTWVLVCNAGHYGGKYRIARRARLEDPSFQVLLFNSPGILGKIRDLIALRLGRPGIFGSVRSFMTDHVRIAGEAAECVQIDGDTAGHPPVDISLLPGRLRLIMPRARE